MAQNIVHLGKRSVCTWNKCCWVFVSVNYIECLAVLLIFYIFTGLWIVFSFIKEDWVNFQLSLGFWKFLLVVLLVFESCILKTCYWAHRLLELDCYVLLMNSPTHHHYYSICSSIFAMKSTLSKKKIATPAFFWLLLAECIFPHSLAFSLPVSLYFIFC